MPDKAVLLQLSFASVEVDSVSEAGGRCFVRGLPLWPWPVRLSRFLRRWTDAVCLGGP